MNIGKRVAIFDLDGTLINGDSYLLFLYRCVRQFGGATGSLWRVPYYTALYLVGMASNTALKEAFLEAGLEGRAVKDVQEVAKKFAEYLVGNYANEGLVQALKAHQRDGARVVLATASPDLYVREVAKQLGISEVICTLVEVKEGYITGRLLGGNCYGVEKVKRLEEILTPSEFESSVCYTDHYSDLPMLQKVKQGILVRPSWPTRFRLRRHGFLTLN